MCLMQTHNSLECAVEGEREEGEEGEGGRREERKEKEGGGRRERGRRR